MIKHLQITLCFIFFSGLIACGNTQTTPDEFSILPTKPLEFPENYTQLPNPNSHKRNITALTPIDSSIAILGGNPDLLNNSQIYKSESPLLKSISRYGITQNIRDITAQEDAVFRKNNKPRLLERWINKNNYSKQYRTQVLNGKLELERLRKKGIKTLTIPPKQQNP